MHHLPRQHIWVQTAGHCAGTGQIQRKKNLKIPEVSSASWFLVCGPERVTDRKAFPLGSWMSPFVWGGPEQERGRPPAVPTHRAGGRKGAQTESRGASVRFCCIFPTEHSVLCTSLKSINSFTKWQPTLCRDLGEGSGPTLGEKRSRETTATAWGKKWPAAKGQQPRGMEKRWFRATASCGGRRHPVQFLLALVSSSDNRAYYQ